MTKAITNAFAGDISGCLVETNDILIEVFDCYDCAPGQQGCFTKIKEGQPCHFELYNEGAENLVFAALDNCILQSHQQSRCDFVIGNFQKLYFVEIKWVKMRHKADARNNAIQQLGNSITLFRKSIKLDTTELVAVICFASKQILSIQTPKQARPGVSAAGLEKRVAFKENYGADLIEERSQTF
jgi:hypothetical protein